MANIIRVGGNGSAAAKEVAPSYTGNSQIFGDGTKGYIECYESGVLTFNTNVTVDVFLVGGGGGGGNGTNGAGGGGGGSGYTVLSNNISFSKNEEIAVTIGAGGSGGANGGATSIADITANGGYTGPYNGGNGGSGGGGGSNSGSGGGGGSNGSNGVGLRAGTGQGTSTYEFLNSQLRLFAGGGGGGGLNNDYTGGAGGSGGGGNGGYRSSATGIGFAGTANTGGGGGGGGGTRKSGGAGGSGIAIIRWGDWTTA